VTSTIWTFGGGAAAADTFLFPHPADDRKSGKIKPRAPSDVTKFPQSLEPLVLFVRPTFVEEPNPDFEACN
jgi:hypothetical protein